MPFWRTKTLAENGRAEWGSLCDAAGAAAVLNKLEYEDTGEMESGDDVACRLFDDATCRCRREYANRHERVPDCLGPECPESVSQLSWLPPTCAYRLVGEGGGFLLVASARSGNPETVHTAGISVRGRTVSEKGVPMGTLEGHVVRWPGEVPRRARRR